MFLRTADTEIEIAGGDTATDLNLNKRVDLIDQHTNLRGARVLDCGCGGGDYVEALRQRGAQAVGLEYDEGKLSRIPGEAPTIGSVLRGDAENLPYPDNTFDIVILNEVLEHIPNDLDALRDLRRVCKPDGTLVLFSPNRLYPFESHGVFRRNSDKFVPPHTPFIPYIPLAIGTKFFRYWARNYWPSELRRIVEAAGFDVTDNSYVWQTFEGVSGNQAGFVGKLAPVLRKIAGTLEKLPVARNFGVSQLIIATPYVGDATTPAHSANRSSLLESPRGIDDLSSPDNVVELRDRVSA